jgi:DNA repair protein RadC
MASTKIHELPEQDRPREKLARLGATALTDSELIAILLRTGLPGANAVDVARQLLQRFGSLAGLARCTVPELSAIKGVGPAKSVQLAAAFGLASRLARESLEKLPMSTPPQIHALLGDELRALHQESLRVVLLDTKMRLMRVEEVSMGTLTETSAHPREIFRPAILHAAYAIVLVHNHPSGDPAPSEADRRLTTRLVETGRLLQIAVIDHIIIGSAAGGRQPWFSFREVGMIV